MSGPGGVCALTGGSAERQKTQKSQIDREDMRNTLPTEMRKRNSRLPAFWLTIPESRSLKKCTESAKKSRGIRKGGQVAAPHKLKEFERSDFERIAV